MARKKLDLTGALEEIIQREQEAQRLFEESGRREQLFRSEEERETDEAILEEEPEYDWTVTVPSGDFEESKIEKITETKEKKLPEPEVLDFIEQSTKGDRETHRPDLYPEYYGAGKKRQSTAVQAMQWVPTSVEELEMSELADPLFKGFPESTGLTQISVVGDLLVAYARPSKSQTTTGTLYIISGVSKELWEAIKNSESFGRSTRGAGFGRLYSEEDGSRYKSLHPDEEYWLFNLSWTSPRDIVTPPPPRVKKTTVRERKRGKRDIFK
ncbi:hypothetical protein UFOVP629_120 [uncultured Caudovirales phage]|uniref:Uncharacterized protein n=1 Tax=uncultured Caudovirales phage TaxID=2100421 RepID=A0A6J5N5M1_9CAUD|nr:hypothetical protein UFOVP629_120 [uncultured Caudovirales phage]